MVVRFFFRKENSIRIERNGETGGEREGEREKERAKEREGGRERIERGSHRRDRYVGKRPKRARRG